RVPDRHAHDRDRRVDAAERRDARDAAAGADDDLAADLLAEDPVRGADVVSPLRRDGRGLETEAVLADCGGGVVDAAVLRRAPALEREVEARQVDLEPRHVPCEHAEALVDELLSRLVAFDYGYCQSVAH